MRERWITKRWMVKFAAVLLAWLVVFALAWSLFGCRMPDVYFGGTHYHGPQAAEVPNPAADEGPTTILEIPQ